MKFRKVHFLSGLIISVFIGMHLINHGSAVLGEEKHIEVMNSFRKIYRNVFLETILISAVVVQIFSGLSLFRSRKNQVRSFFENLPYWSGLYLAFFLLIHLSAVFFGRLVLDLDTNFYFGAAGLNTFPYNLFFIPYYSLAIVSFFGHISAIHFRKMNGNLLFMSPKNQAVAILIFGFIVTFFLIFNLTNGFQGVEIPDEYGVLTGN
ncbi:hypothetical protein D0X99_16645 [Algoriphagus lacus]|uniref:Succinate dehydrogenase n=1 Tax=Algoriphagus lacus TaxID=2056311 RepID=A0A418PNH3_9BACT|nr:hypothetical protein [Algoriphagus lacus]RIW13399.1 hypothetical protein D0X99_16645 [Algoriphagus lacus]